MSRSIHVNLEAQPADDAVIGADLATLLEAAVDATLADHDVAEAEISLTLLDDDGIADLNERYLGHEGPTDVIAFAMNAPGAPPLGDLYIGLDQAIRQARALGVPPLEELARLAVHGTLHILGHDHPEGEERLTSPMWARQETILERVVETSRGRE